MQLIRRICLIKQRSGPHQFLHRRLFPYTRHRSKSYSPNTCSLFYYEAQITFLWPAPWTFVKIVFFVARYSPFLDSAVTIAGGSSVVSY